MEMQTANQLLTDLVACLPQLSTVDELDMRMQGKLELLLQLVRVLGSRCLASTDSQQLVHLLLTGLCWNLNTHQSQRLSIDEHCCMFPKLMRKSKLCKRLSCFN